LNFNLDIFYIYIVYIGCIFSLSFLYSYLTCSVSQAPCGACCRSYEHQSIMDTRIRIDCCSCSYVALYMSTVVFVRNCCKRSKVEWKKACIYTSHTWAKVITCEKETLQGKHISINYMLQLVLIKPPLYRWIAGRIFLQKEKWKHMYRTPHVQLF
jgi:hypothetical protein